MRTVLFSEIATKRAIRVMASSRGTRGRPAVPSRAVRLDRLAAVRFFGASREDMVAPASLVLP